MEANNLSSFRESIKDLTHSGIPNIEKIQQVGSAMSVVGANMVPEIKENAPGVGMQGMSENEILLKQRKAAVCKIILVLLKDMATHFNIVRPMSNSQILDLAVEMTDDLWLYKFEEVAAFIEGIKREAFGEVRDRLDASTIWRFWEIYAKDRMAYFQQLDDANRGSVDDRNSNQIIHAKNVRENLEKINDHFQNHKK